MRADVAEALEEACSPSPRAGAGCFGVDGRLPKSTEKARRVFLGRLRVFLREIPQDVTLSELLDEIR